jgi:hypothetical protein
MIAPCAGPISNKNQAATPWVLLNVCHRVLVDLDAVPIPSITVHDFSPSSVPVHHPICKRQTYIQIEPKISRDMRHITPTLCASALTAAHQT